MEIVKKFDVGKKKYGLRKLTNKETNDIDVKSKAAYAKAIREGCATDIEIEKMISDRHMDDEIESKKRQSFIETIVKLEAQLENEKISDKEKLGIVRELSENRTKFIQLTTKFQHLFENSADSIARDDRVRNMFVESLLDLDSGEKVFKSKDEFDNLTDDENIEKIYSQFLFFVYDIDKDFDKKLPENEWMVEHGYLDKDLRPIDQSKNKTADKPKIKSKSQTKRKTAQKSKKVTVKKE